MGKRPYYAESFFCFCFFYIGKLDTHPVDLEPTTSPSTLILQGKEVPFDFGIDLS
jgi:hypothetical protein